MNAYAPQTCANVAPFGPLAVGLSCVCSARPRAPASARSSTCKTDPAARSCPCVASESRDGESARASRSGAARARDEDKGFEMTSLIAILIGLGMQVCGQGQSRQADDDERMSALVLRSSRKAGSASGAGGDPNAVATSRPATSRPSKATPRRHTQRKPVRQALGRLCLAVVPAPETKSAKGTTTRSATPNKPASAPKWVPSRCPTCSSVAPCSVVGARL